MAESSDATVEVCSPDVGETTEPPDVVPDTIELPGDVAPDDAPDVGTELPGDVAPEDTSELLSEVIGTGITTVPEVDAL